MDLTIQMLQHLKDEKAAINETIAALEHLAQRQAKGGRSTEREVVGSPPVSVAATSNRERHASVSRKRSGPARTA